jgi:hypothetical protein
LAWPITRFTTASSWALPFLTLNPYYCSPVFTLPISSKAEALAESFSYPCTTG